MKKLTTWVSIVLSALPLASFGITQNLSHIYQLAAAQNATYQAAKFQYLAVKDAVGVSRAALLPQLSASSSMQWIQHDSERVANVGLTLTQSIINVANWRTYSQSQASAQLAAVTYAHAKESLLYDVSTHYFTVLSDADQLAYARANVAWQKKTLSQVKAQYEVGVKAQKDVLSARANYESALATLFSDETTLQNNLQVLNQMTGSNITQIAALKTQFPLIQPKPANENAWGERAAQMNLNVQLATMQKKVDYDGIGVAASDFFPTVSVSAAGSQNFFDNSTHTANVTATANYNFFSSGATVFATKAADDTYDSDKFTLTQAKREARAAAVQDYLSILSDLEQIKAYKQAIVASESAVKATSAGYKVGTETIVNLLQQQTTLFENQSLYAKATYSYIEDSIKLKRDTGTLTESVIKALNTWLTSKPAF